MKTSIPAPEGNDNKPQMSKAVSPWKTKIMAALMPVAGMLGVGQVQGQNLIAATTNTTPPAGEVGETMVDQYAKEKRALEFLVKQSALATPDKGDDSLQTQGDLYRMLVADYEADGKLSQVNEGIVDSLAAELTKDPVIAKIGNQAIFVLTGKEVVTGSVGEIESESPKKTTPENKEPEVIVDSIVRDMGRDYESKFPNLVTFEEGEIQIGQKLGEYNWLRKTIELTGNQKGKKFIASWIENENGVRLVVKLTPLGKDGTGLENGITVINNKPLELPNGTKSIFIEIVSDKGSAQSVDRGVVSGSINKIGFIEDIQSSSN